jgi:hypothetical protein
VFLHRASQEDTQRQKDHLQNEKGDHAQGYKTVKFTVRFVLLCADQRDAPGNKQQDDTVHHHRGCFGGHHLASRDRQSEGKLYRFIAFFF